MTHILYDLLPQGPWDQLTTFRFYRSYVRDIVTCIYDLLRSHFSRLGGQLKCPPEATAHELPTPATRRDSNHRLISFCRDTHASTISTSYRTSFDPGTRSCRSNSSNHALTYTLIEMKRIDTAAPNRNLRDQMKSLHMACKKESCAFTTDMLEY
jgi:hypothetical protein